MKNLKELYMSELFFSQGFDIVVDDLTNGNDVSSNNGNYIETAQFRRVGEHKYVRLVMSFHGDLEAFPVWKCVSSKDYLHLIKCGLKDNDEIDKRFAGVRFI